MTDHTVKKNPASIPHSVWPADDLRRAEKEAADSLGITLYELMLRAGEATFAVARRAYPQANHWLILCRGPTGACRRPHRHAPCTGER